MSEDSPTISDDDDLPIKVPGPLRRSKWLLLTLLAALVVGPWISRYIETYRVVVLDVRDDEMLFGYATLPPRWVARTDAKPGQIVAKERFSWSPDVSKEQLRDKPLLDLYVRYADSYQGTIVKIRDPYKPDGAHVAVVKIDRGGEVTLPLWADHLAGAEVGRRVEKLPGSWDPVLTDDRATTARTQPVPPARPPPSPSPSASGSEDKSKAP